MADILLKNAWVILYLSTTFPYKAFAFVCIAKGFGIVILSSLWVTQKALQLSFFFSFFFSSVFLDEPMEAFLRLRVTRKAFAIVFLFLLLLLVIVFGRECLLDCCRRGAWLVPLDALEKCYLTNIPFGNFMCYKMTCPVL